VCDKLSEQLPIKLVFCGLSLDKLGSVEQNINHPQILENGLVNKNFIICFEKHQNLEKFDHRGQFVINLVSWMFESIEVVTLSFWMVGPSNKKLGNKMIKPPVDLIFSLWKLVLFQIPVMVQFKNQNTENQLQ
jgi:hypothetical protein